MTDTPPTPLGSPRGGAQGLQWTPARAPAAPRGPSGGHRRRPAARLPARDGRHPRRHVERPRRTPWPATHAHGHPAIAHLTFLRARAPTPPRLPDRVPRGPSRRRASSTAASRSRALLTARWSSTRSTAARPRTWPTLKARFRAPCSHRPPPPPPARALAVAAAAHARRPARSGRARSYVRQTPTPRRGRTTSAGTSTCATPTAGPSTTQPAASSTGSTPRSPPSSSGAVTARRAPARGGRSQASAPPAFAQAAGGPNRQAPWMAPGGAAHPRRRRAHVGLALRLWPVLFPQRPADAPGRYRAVLLPAQDGVAPRSAVSLASNPGQRNASTIRRGGGRACLRASRHRRTLAGLGEATPASGTTSSTWRNTSSACHAVCLTGLSAHRRSSRPPPPPSGPRSPSMISNRSCRVAGHARGPRHHPCDVPD